MQQEALSVQTTGGTTLPQKASADEALTEKALSSTALPRNLASTQGPLRGVLVLWDVDGTLLATAPDCLRWLRRALRDIYALPVDPILGEAHGKTDQQIALETLASAGVDEATARAGLEAFMRRYRELMATADLDTLFAPLPGAREALTAVRERGATQSLLTGNLQGVAARKMAHFGLDDLLDLELGAYGSDSENRLELVQVAVARFTHHRGQPPTRVVVVGDTPRDVACARAGAARAVAVATGIFGVEQLQATQPDAVLGDLTDLAALAAALG